MFPIDLLDALEARLAAGRMTCFDVGVVLIKTLGSAAKVQEDWSAACSCKYDLNK